MTRRVSNSSRVVLASPETDTGTLNVNRPLGRRSSNGQGNSHREDLVLIGYYQIMRCAVVLILLGLVAAESGLDGWLRYAPIDIDPPDVAIPSRILSLNATDGGPVQTAADELVLGITAILRQTTTITDAEEEQDICDSAGYIVVGTYEEYASVCDDATAAAELEEDGFWLDTTGESVKIIGRNERGALYGTFEYLSMLGQGNISQVAYATNPSAPIRWANQWDNMDDTGTHGSVERGYGGPSIFFAEGKIVKDMERVAQYARLLASIRINGIIVNNVNANPALLTATNMNGLARIADAMRPYGVRVGISLNFASPQELGGLDTFDPLEESVIEWWTEKSEALYERIPDMLGYLVKANSEGQPGPLQYNRTLADGANMFAKTIEPHGGIVMFRAFVYDQLDWNDWRADRANAGVEFFKDLDGKFDDNVVVQIKYGPIDFQVREPPSPLFANLRNTSMAIELQVSQEYLGHQNHLVYLPPLWRTILDFDLKIDGEPSVVSDILSGQRFGRKLGGYAAVINVGTDTTWLGSHLAMSNLYAYGRMAWDPSVNEEDIIQDWTRLTFGLDQEIIDTITQMSMLSWIAYENYTGNLGIQTLVDILYTHFGPNPASMDNNGWGQWTRADTDSIGMDRTVANGTRNAGQYPPEVAAAFEGIETTPDELLLWFHHVPYTHVLKSGKTVIQHFYDAHYEGAATAQTFVPMWESLRQKIDGERWAHIRFLQIFQAGHSILWRDAINNFYHTLSGIDDEAGRVGNYSYRIEAEDMELEGFVTTAVEPAEMASGSMAIVAEEGVRTATATTVLEFATGTYDIAINYFDVVGGQAFWRVFLNDVRIGEWSGNGEDRLGHWPSEFLDGHSASRVTFLGIGIEEGDELRIVGVPGGEEMAPLDYISILPEGVVD